MVDPHEYKRMTPCRGVTSSKRSRIESVVFPLQVGHFGGCCLKPHVRRQKGVVPLGKLSPGPRHGRRILRASTCGGEVDGHQ